MTDIKEKLLHVMDLRVTKDLVVAFSGGVDSALLLTVAAEFASYKKLSLLAITFHTKLHPMQDLEEAKNLATSLNISHQIIRCDELTEAGISDNPENRCYLCKKYLFEKLRHVASQKGISCIMDGTNYDDMQVHRPGIKALQELNIISPLAEAKLTKADVRAIASEYGISVANRPSTPCLATRFTYGTPLRYDMLENVEKAEIFLNSLGFYNIRVRVHGPIARIEVDADDIAKLFKHKETLVTSLKEYGYTYITIDLEGFRSGSMDYGITTPR